MKRIFRLLPVALLLAAGYAAADPATEQEVRQTILDGNAYVRENLRGPADSYSQEGAVEFWSSGGLMQTIAPGGPPQEFEAFNIHVKHIHVTTLVPGRAAIAHYYSEGSMHPKGSSAVGNYRTRVSQVYVKEGGKWKIRASHWSPIAGGAGTSQTAIDE